MARAIHRCELPIFWKKASKLASKVCVIGCGYIGLPTAVLLASKDVAVHGVDTNEVYLQNLISGRFQSNEPGLRDMLQEVLRKNKLTLGSHATEADVFLIAVPTPFHDDGLELRKPDLTFVKQAVENITDYLQKDNLLIVESTCPVGTTEKIVSWIKELRPDLADGDKINVNIAFCPERVLPGAILNELVTNPRVIVGLTPDCASKASSFYKWFVKAECITTDAKTAEMAKLTENASRDLQIAFANELSIICDELSIDVWELIKLCNLHPRVDILAPGPGVGGHCIAVDPWFIISELPQQAALIQNARKRNLEKEQWVIKKIEEVVSSNPHTRFVFFGVAYKPDAEDLRESPSLRIVQHFQNFDDIDLAVVEPNILGEAIDDIKFIKLQEVDLEKDFCFMLVGHTDFKLMSEIPKKMIDFVGLYK